MWYVLHIIVFLVISILMFKWAYKLLRTGKDKDIMNFMILGMGLMSLGAGFSLLTRKYWLRTLSIILSIILLVGLIIYTALCYRGGGWGPYMTVLISPFMLLCLYAWIYLSRSKFGKE